MPILNTASSVIDYYKSKGFKPAQGEAVPLFSQRKSDFERLGLNKQLGDFRGSGTQNTALLNALTRAEKSTGVSMTPQNLQSMVNIARGETAPKQQVQQQEAQTEFPEYRMPSGQSVIPQSQAEAESLVAGGGRFQPRQAPQGSVEEVVIPSQQQAPQQQGVPPEIQQRIDQIQKVPTAQALAQQASEKFFGSPEFPQQQEAIEAEKEKVKLGAQRETESFISQIASRGLFFSGKKQTGVSSIEADKLADLLGIDRKFALFITQGLQTSAQQVAKEAQAGSKQAMDALEKLGFTINPLTGGVEPTLEARKSQRQEEQQQLQAQQFQQQEARREAESVQREAQFQQTQQRLETQAQMQQERFETQNALAEARLAVQSAQGQANLKLAEQRLALAEKNAAKVNQQLISGVLTNQQFQRVNTLADNARQDQNIKTFDSVRDSFQRIATAAESKDHGVGDLTLLRSFAKLTDPTTGVREEEYRTMQQALGSLQRLGVNVTTGMVSGAQLTPAGRKAFLNMSNDLYNAHKTNYDQAVNFYKDQAINSGVDPKLVLPRITSSVTPTTLQTGKAFSVKAPNGKDYTFKSQADLDKFKKSAGIK